MMTEKELRAAIEAVLLVAGEPVTQESLVEAFGDEEKVAIAAQLEQIQNFFSESVGGFTLEQTAGGYRFVTRPEYDPYLRKFFSKQNEGRLSLAALETLAIIAYRQPITAPEISEIRGVNTAGVLRTLLDRKMIRIAGRKNVVGSPFLYRTTREFLLHFGLNSIQDLPRLEEFGEILGENLSEDLIGSIAAAGEGEGEGEGEGGDGGPADAAGEETAPGGETRAAIADDESQQHESSETPEPGPAEGDELVQQEASDQPIEAAEYPGNQQVEGGGAESDEPRQEDAAAVQSTVSDETE